ncbi:MAG: hypothetical protein ABIN89_27135 [Chitinophagaceae bacterium]
MDRERGYRRLVKKFEGMFRLLKEDTTLYEMNRNYIVTVDCLGDHIIIYIDGVEKFEAFDKDLAKGQVGLYCWANSGACFTDVRVALPEWINYYRFGKEVPFSAGMRIKISTTKNTSVSGNDSNLTQRSFSIVDKENKPELSYKGVDLRIQSSQKKPEHTKHFLPETNYNTITGIRLLRKADGTGMFITAPTGSALSLGEYRLRLSYLRETQDSSQQILSESGNKNPELVSIDFPMKTATDILSYALGSVLSCIPVLLYMKPAMILISHLL